MQSSGIITTSASSRGSTRNSIGSRPMVSSASISWFTCMVPSCAANPEPVRPAMTTAVMRQPISRAMAMRDQVGDVERGAEPLQLHGADERDDDAGDERHERHDRQRLHAALLDEQCEVAPADVGAAGDEAAKGGRRIADERQRVDGHIPGTTRADTDLLEPRGGDVDRTCALPLGDRLGEPQQALHGRRQAAAVDRHAVPSGRVLHPRDEGQHPGVPMLQPGQVEDHTCGRRRCRKGTFDGQRNGQALRQPPRSAQPHDQRPVRTAADLQMRVLLRFGLSLASAPHRGGSCTHSGS